jgi:hypothetical protein
MIGKPFDSIFKPKELHSDIFLPNGYRKPLKPLPLPADVFLYEYKQKTCRPSWFKKEKGTSHGTMGKARGAPQEAGNQ